MSFTSKRHIKVFKKHSDYNVKALLLYADLPGRIRTLNSPRFLSDSWQSQSDQRSLIAESSPKKPCSCLLFCSSWSSCWSRFCSLIIEFKQETRASSKLCSPWLSRISALLTSRLFSSQRLKSSLSAMKSLAAPLVTFAQRRGIPCEHLC